MSLLYQTVLSIGQVIGCEDRFRNVLDCVGWGVKLHSNYQTVPSSIPYGYPYPKKR